jgi:hypothetical protein
VLSTGRNPYYRLKIKAAQLGKSMQLFPNSKNHKSEKLLVSSILDRRY